MQTKNSSRASSVNELFRPQRLPDLEVVGYLHRWCVKARNKQGNQYLHNIIGPDEPTPHDHPWDFKTVILTGGYIEWTPDGMRQNIVGDVIEHTASSLHYIDAVLPNTWTMVLTGPVVRDWGFRPFVELGAPAVRCLGEWVSAKDHRRDVEIITRNGYNGASG